ncbi:MAG: dockerin type I domain-containing protein [Oscillospiraceae bacterium]|nr:dockerin type I domain-containing protein [Oscillospiraceae bacterium]
MNKAARFAGCFLAAVMMASSAVSFNGTADPVYQNTSVVYAAEASVKIQKSAGFGEGMYATWSSVSGASGYNVYVDGTQIDSMLIRQYSGYMRADAVGLKAGSHTMKIVPVINGKEDASKAGQATATAYAHDRSGYGFTGGSSSGAYNNDGTLKSNALVVYVTNSNKDTVKAKLNVEGKGEVECTGIQNIILGYKKGKETRPMAVRIIGNITDPAVLTKGDLYLDTVTAGMTVEGIGNDATINGFGIVLKNCVNVEVRNLGFMNCNSEEGDDCGLQQGNSYCWVHNCDFFYGDAGSDADQVKGDGALDTKKSHNITHSYNHFFDNGKCNLQGANASDTSNYITYHHNWYDHSDSRHPRVRVATVHVYNNYYDGNAKYGIGSTTDSDVFAENNYFRNCAKPMLISNQGSEGGLVLSGEPGGMIKAYGNVIEGNGKFVSYKDNNTDFDAYVASSRTEQVPSSVKAKNGGATYNNFDTASGFYKYTVDAAKDVPSIVTSKAGRVDGGDFKWNFNNSVDDASYAVNTALKSALTGYKSSLVAVGSGFKEDNAPAPTQTPATSAPQTPATAAPTSAPAQPPASGSAAVYNFTTDTSSAVFTMAGSVQNDKGALTHNGLTLTKCLKMDSQGSLSFTTSGPATVTIVAKSKADGGILKVNGENAVSGITMNGGVYTYKAPAAGTYTITKGTNESYIYYIVVDGAASSQTPATSAPQTPATSAPASSAESPVTQAPAASANVIYCSPSGSGDGKSVDSPANVLSAIRSVPAGGTIYLLEGTYKFTETIMIDKDNSGKAGALKTISAYPGAKVKFDFTGQKTDASSRGFVLCGSYWHFYGFEITKAGDNGMLLAGSNNKIEMMVFNDNQDTGLQISRYDTSAATIDTWPSNNLVLNCTSKNNCDDETMENADGFAAKLTCGQGNVFDGCMAYNNSDDGWDLFAKEATGPIGIVTIKNSIAFRNGFTEFGEGYGDCDGNGFKLGGSGIGSAHVVENCLAFENLHCGFTDNNNPKLGSLTNCTSFNNNMEGKGKPNFSLYRCTDDGCDFKNILSVYDGSVKIADGKLAGGGSNDKFVGTFENGVYYNSGYYKVDAKTNVTNGAKIGTKLSAGPAASDFAAYGKAPAQGTDFHTAWRNPDGSIWTGGLYQTASSGQYAKLGAHFTKNDTVPEVKPVTNPPAPAETAPAVTTAAPVTEPSAPAATQNPPAATSAPAATATPAATVQPAPGSFKYGDINSDGRVDITDLSIFAVHLVDKTPFTDVQNKAADVDGDGEVGITDLAHFKQYISKVVDWLGVKP